MRTSLIVGLVGLLGMMLAAGHHRAEAASPSALASDGRFQLIDAHFENAYLRSQGSILKLDTATGESWRYMVDDSGGFHWVPIDTLKTGPERKEGSVSPRWKNADGTPIQSK